MFRRLLTISSTLAVLTIQAVSAQTSDEIVDNSDIDSEASGLPGQVADTSLNVDEILAQHFKARGGVDATQGLASIKGTGKVVVWGAEVPGVLYFKRPNSYRIQADLQGQDLILAYDGEVAWELSPRRGIIEPEEMSADDDTAVAVISNFVWGLLTAEDRPAVELVGVEKMGQDGVYHLQLSSGSGDVEILLGGEDFLVYKLSFEASREPITTTLGDYMRVGNTQLPSSIVTKGGTLEFAIKIESFEANPEIDDSLFNMPDG